MKIKQNKGLDFSLGWVWH